MANPIIDTRNIIIPPGNVLGTYPSTGEEIWRNTQPVQTPLIPGPARSPPQSTTLPPVGGQQSTTNVTDVNLYAYMRGIYIDIVARNLRPNRQVYVFFDGKDVGKLIQQPNIIAVDNSEVITTTLGTPTSNITNGAVNIYTTEEVILVSNNNAQVVDSDLVDDTMRVGRARVLYAQSKSGGQLTYLYLSNTYDANNSVSGNSTVAVINSSTGIISNTQIIRESTNFLKKSRRYLENTLNGMSNEDIEEELAKNKAWRIDKKNVNEEDIVGTTITLLNGSNPGITRTIVSYNVSNGEIYLSSGFPGTFEASSNIIYTLDNVDPTINSNNTIIIDGVSAFVDNGAPDVVEAGLPTNISSTKLYTDETGTFVGTLYIPDPSVSEEYRFRVGEKLLRISDSPTNNPDNATTIAEYIFVAFGLSLDKRQVVFSGTSTSTRQTQPTPSGEGSSSNTSSGNVRTTKSGRRDPTAQSFYIDPQEYPNGFFTPYVDLFFANKGTLPIEVQIRAMVNGFPSSSDILPYATSILDSVHVNVSDAPNPNDPDTYTRFIFQSPIYLSPDTEYALVVITNDFDYDIYVSELGEKIIGSDRIVSEQPYLGSLFKSQNARTYTPIQLEDMMFVIHKCVFDTTGTVSYTEMKDRNYIRPRSRPVGTDFYAADAFELHSDAIEFPGTSLTYSYRAKTFSNNTFDATYTEFKPEKLIPLDVRKVINSPEYTSDKTFFMRVDLSTNSPDISPILYTNKQSLGVATTLINKLELNGSKVIIANTGNGYTSQNTSVIFNSDAGQGANAKVIIKSEPYLTGKIAYLNFDSEGSGYADNVTVTISSTDGNDAVVIVPSETDKSGGPAIARYISKTVTLAPEFEAGDLRVYLTAINPKEAIVNVYYKVRNKFDTEPIDDKYWMRMRRVPGIGEYTTGTTPIEYEYRPSLSSNNIIYSTDSATFDTFSQYKIKIVMSSTDTVLSKIPYIYEMIAIALPADTE